MSKRLKMLAVAALVLSAAARGRAAEPDTSTKASVDSAHIEALIKELNADSFGERTAARRELFNIGRPALAALEYASKSDDTELRIAANELLISLRGRGFMGVNLQEEQPPDEESEEGPPRPGAIDRPTVRVIGIANASSMGLKKPFPAELGGVATSDKLLEVNGKPVCGVKDLMREVINIGPTNIALIMIERDGRKLRLPLLLTRNPMLRDTVPVDLEKDAPVDPPQGDAKDPAKPDATTTEKKPDDAKKDVPAEAPKLAPVAK